MAEVGMLFAGGGVGALFTLLYDAVKDVKDKTMMFRELLQDLDSTLEALKPLIKDVAKYKAVLDQSNMQVEKIDKLMKNGLELVLECSKPSPRKGFKKYKYAMQLGDLDKRLNRLLTVLTVEGIRNGLETLAVSRENLAFLREIAGVVREKLAVSRETFGVARETLAVSRETFGVAMENLAVSGETFVVARENLAVSGETFVVSENLAVSREISGVTSEIMAMSKEIFTEVQKNGSVGSKENVVTQDEEGFHDLGSVPEPPLVTVGLDEPLRDLKKMLLKDDVSMLVLTATGGCGKTTLASKVCQDEKVKDKFKKNIYLLCHRF